MLKRYIALASALCMITFFVPKCPFNVTGSSGKSRLVQTPAASFTATTPAAARL